MSECAWMIFSLKNTWTLHLPQQYNCSYCKEGICSKDKCTYGCEDGYYQGSETCYPCNTHCISCSSFQNCHSCRHGYYGSNCQHTCITCSPCDKDTGSCITSVGTFIRPMSGREGISLVTTIIFRYSDVWGLPPQVKAICHHMTLKVSVRLKTQ